MKSLFDLRCQSSIDLDRLIMGIESGIADAHRIGLKEVEETLIAFRLIVTLAKKEAIERESNVFVSETIKEIFNQPKV